LTEKQEIQNDWIKLNLEQVIGEDSLFKDGDWIESKDQDPDGDVRLIQLADIGDGFFRNRSDRYLTHKKSVELGCTFLEKGDLLIARMPDPLGRACLFPGDSKTCVTAVDVCIIRTKHVEHKWLMYAINSPEFRADVESLQSGSTRKRISRKNLAKIVVPIPPRDEQISIVSKIEELFSQLDAGVAGLKRVQSVLQRYRASVLKAAFEGRLVPQDPNDEPVQWNFDKKKINEDFIDKVSNLPSKWSYGIITNLVSKPSLTGIKLLKRDYKEKGKYPVIDQGQDYIGGFTEEEKPVPCELPVIVFGDHTKVIKYVDFPFVAGADGIKVLKPKDVLLPKLFYYFIQAIKLPDKGYARHYQYLAKELIPIPPLAEQKRIIDEIESKITLISVLEEQVEKNIKLADKLRQSILHSAFQGNLVRQTHNEGREGLDNQLDKLENHQTIIQRGLFNE